MKALFPLLTLALIAGCGGVSDEEKKPEPTAQVRTARATLASASDTVTIYGATEAGPNGTRAIVAPAEAIVAAIDAPTGTAVHAGQAIVTLRPSPTTRTEITKAASDSATAAAAYQRAVRMRADGLVSNADVETARAALATASATRNNIGMSGGRLVLRAMGAGTVQGLTAKVGDQLASGTTVATIGGSGDVRARFGMEPALARRMRPGQAIHFETIDGGNGMDATVMGIDPQIDATTRLASVYVHVPGHNLGAGQPLRASVALGAASTGVSIPYAALLDDGGRSYVFVVKNGVARSVDVSPGNSSGDRIQILKGLNPGDTVVTEGGTALEDGMKVATRAGTAK